MEEPGAMAAALPLWPQVTDCVLQGPQNLCPAQRPWQMRGSWGGSEHPAPTWAMPNVQLGWSSAPSPGGRWVLHPHCQSRDWSLGGCRDPSTEPRRLCRPGCSDSPHWVQLLGDLQLF